jgi:mono/diheme cytochrome c family protein
MARTTRRRWRWLGVLALASLWMVVSTGWGADVVPAAEAVPVSSGIFTEAQAEAGLVAFVQHCAGCHGAELQGGFGPRLAPLDPFQFRDRPLALLYTFMRTQMPFDAPGSLDDERYAAILAHVLVRNGYPFGLEPLPADPDDWPAFMLDDPPAP